MATSGASKRSMFRRVASSRLVVECLEDRRLLSSSPGDALLVQWKPGTEGSAAMVARLVEDGPASLAPTGIPDLYEVRGEVERLSLLRTELAAEPGVSYVEPAQTIRISLVPNDPNFTNGSLWGLSGVNGIQAPSAWDFTTGSTSVTVAD